MTDALPKIWNTTFTDHTINLRYIDFHIVDNTVPCRAACSRAFLYPDGKPLAPDLMPNYVFFKYRDHKEDYKSKTPDLIMIEGGLLLISEKFRNLLADFDMGTSLIHEVPLYENDQKTLRPGRWFILHITANKKTVIPEMSENVEQIGASSHWRPRVAQKDVIAVRADAAQGADLWIDPHTRPHLPLRPPQIRPETRRTPRSTNANAPLHRHRLTRSPAARREAPPLPRRGEGLGVGGNGTDTCVTTTLTLAEDPDDRRTSEDLEHDLYRSHDQCSEHQLPYQEQHPGSQG